MNWLMTHAVVAAVACGVPLLVVAVVFRFARRHAGEVVWRAAGGRIGWLAVATVLAWIGFAVWLVVDSAAVAAGQRGLALATGELAVFAVLFGGLAMPSMRAISRALPPAPEPDLDRAATLVPRTLRRYLSWPAASLPYLLATGAVVTVGGRIAAQDLEGPQNLGAAIAVAVFVLVALYGRWLQETVVRPQTLSTDDAVGQEVAVEGLRQGEIIQVYKWQVGLAVVLSPASVALTYLDFTAVGGMAILAVASTVAAAGCARALTSDLVRYPMQTQP